MKKRVLGNTDMKISPVGLGIKGFRDKIVLATKCGVRHRGDHLEDNRSGRFQFWEEGFRYYQQALDLIRGIAEENLLPWHRSAWAG